MAPKEVILMYAPKIIQEKISLPTLLTRKLKNTRLLIHGWSGKTFFKKLMKRFAYSLGSTAEIFRGSKCKDL